MVTDRLANEQVHALLGAWEAWDNAPTNRDRVVDLEEALADAAAALDTNPLVLRTSLLTARRTGVTYAQALATVRKELAAAT